jgi:hypothetical protein
MQTLKKKGKNVKKNQLLNSVLLLVDAISNLLKLIK